MLFVRDFGRFYFFRYAESLSFMLFFDSVIAVVVFDRWQKKSKKSNPTPSSSKATVTDRWLQRLSCCVFCLLLSFFHILFFFWFYFCASTLCLRVTEGNERNTTIFVSFFFVFAYRLQNNNYVVIGKSMNCTHRPEWMATVTCFMRRVNRTAENWRFDAYINLIVREVYSSSENEFHWLLFTIFVAFVSSLFFQGEIYDVASNERTGVSSVCYN